MGGSTGLANASAFGFWLDRGVIAEELDDEVDPADAPENVTPVASPPDEEDTPAEPDVGAEEEVGPVGLCG